MHEAPKPRARIVRRYQSPTLSTNQGSRPPREQSRGRRDISICCYADNTLLGCLQIRSSVRKGGFQMGRWSMVLRLFLLAALAGCASQAASTPTAGGGSPDIVVLNGCRVDPARICNSVRGQNVTLSGTGLSADPR